MKRLVISISFLLAVLFVPQGAFAATARGVYGRAKAAPVQGQPEPKIDYVAKMNELSKAGRNESLNAAPYYQKAVELCVEMPKELKTLDNSAWPAELSAKEQLLLKQWVQSNSQALSQLELGAKRPYYWIERSSPDGTMTGVRIPGLSKFRHLAYAIRWRAKLHAAEGSTDKAAADVVTCYRFGLHQMGHGTLIEQLVGTAISSIVPQATFEILDRAEPDKAVLEALQSQIEQLSKDENYKPNLQAEKFMVLDIIQRVFTDDGRGDGRIHRPSVERLFQNPGLGTGSGAGAILQANLSRRQTTETVEKVFGYFDSLALKTPWQWKAEGIDPDKEIERMAQENALVAMLCPAVGRATEIFSRCRTHTDALITTLALLRYKADRGRVPVKLDELVSAGYLKTLATDAFSGRPFVYRQVANDFMLYSFALDYDDDGGARSNWGGREQGGDQVFWPVEGAQMAGGQTGTPRPVAGTGRTGKSLHEAAMAGDTGQVQSLISSGADVNAKDMTGYAPLFYAAQRGQKGATELLIGGGADVNAKDQYGNTPLHYAAWSGHYEVCEALVAAGADVSAKNLTGRTASAMAKSQGHNQIAALLSGSAGTGTGITPSGKDESWASRLGKLLGGKSTEPKPKTDPNIVLDANSIKAKIKTFAGLEDELERVERRSRYEVAEWLKKGVDNKAKLAREVYAQERAEVNLIRKISVEEKTKKTTAALDKLLLKRTKVYSGLAKRMAEEAKNRSQQFEQTRSRRGSRYDGRGQRTPERRPPRGRSAREETIEEDTRGQEENEEYGEQDERYGGAEMVSTGVADQNEIEMQQWLQAPADNKVGLATSAYKRIAVRLYFTVRKTAVEESAKKTATAIDGVLLARQVRLGRLVKKMQEESKELEPTRDPRTRRRSGSYDPRRRSSEGRYRTRGEGEQAEPVEEDTTRRRR